MELLTPTDGIQLADHWFLGRGPTATGGNYWSLAGHAFRCARCGDIIPIGRMDNCSCSCGALFMDADYCRLGSQLGDENILVYRSAHSTS